MFKELIEAEEEEENPKTYYDMAVHQCSTQSS